MSAYKRGFDKTKCMPFLIKDEKLLDKYKEIWKKKVSNITKKEIDSKPVYNEKHLKTKIKSYDGKINTNFYKNKILREGSQWICLSAILIESVYRKDKDYYLQAFLEDEMLLKKRRRLTLLLVRQKFILMILIEKVLMKKILVKKIKHRNFLKKVWEGIRNFWGFASSFLNFKKNYKKIWQFFKPGAKKFHFPK